MACSHATSLPPVPTAFSVAGQLPMAFPRDVGYRTVYTFRSNQNDVFWPVGGLTQLNGRLFGEAAAGGVGSQAFGGIFVVTPGGKEQVLHTYGIGDSARGGLRYFHGWFYGTTEAGGSQGDGTVFRISSSGKYRTLYSFQGRPNDGERPLGGLIVLNGTLYGTTSLGGARNVGTIFQISIAGRERILHSFSKADGAYPSDSLTAANEALYGVANKGGAHNAGVIFRADLHGNESVLHSFTGSTGSYPSGDLLELQGSLYGTTVSGGAHKYGTIFRLDSTGNYTVIHSFSGGEDGCHPYAGLMSAGKILLGTTAGDNKVSCGSFGTIYRLANGTVKTLHSFAGGFKGGDPGGKLALMGGKVYGTAFSGGAYLGGIVYSVNP